MFQPDHVQHHHSTRFSLVVKLLNKNKEWTVSPLTLHNLFIVKLDKCDQNQYFESNIVLFDSLDIPSIIFGDRKSQIAPALVNFLLDLS